MANGRTELLKQYSRLPDDASYTSICTRIKAACDNKQYSGDFLISTPTDAPSGANRDLLVSYCAPAGGTRAAVFVFDYTVDRVWYGRVSIVTGSIVGEWENVQFQS